MASDPFLTVPGDGFEAVFMLGADDTVDNVENVDAEIRLPDGTRWSATVMTPGEITSILARWRETGETGAGAFFACPDLVVVPTAGVEAMMRAFHEIMRSGGPEGTLQKLS